MNDGRSLLNIITYASLMKIDFKHCAQSQVLKHAPLSFKVSLHGGPHDCLFKPPTNIVWATFTQFGRLGNTYVASFSCHKLLIPTQDTTSPNRVTWMGT